MESLTLTTNDGVSISADYFPAEGKRAVILLHMMPATKESWHPFAEVLQRLGIASIMIDERGHGASSGGPDGYRNFSPEQHLAKLHDVRAAWAALKERGAMMEKTGVIGASIGANLAIRYLAENGSFPIGVALSPGMSYHGVTTDDAIVRLTPGQHVLLVASEEDTEAAKAIQVLNEKNKTQTQLLLRHDLGHGTHMFDADAELLEAVATWVNERI